MKMDKINLITKNKKQIYINAEESSEDIYERQRMVRDLILAAIALYLIDGERKKLLDTIKSNISLGRPGATDEEIVEACKVANAHNFIMESPEGYDTNIGDHGSKLSGGQRQRLSIARAVLKNPEFLILDEATSALDTESEKLVQDALTKLLKGRTSVVIAHRLSTIMNADRIFVIDDGHIVEQGKHDELIAKGGVYAKLVELQNVK